MANKSIPYEASYPFQLSTSMGITLSNHDSCIKQYGRIFQHKIEKGLKDL